MTFMYFMIFVALFMGVIVLATGSILAFFNTLSVMVVVLGILLFVLASGRWADFSCGIKHFFQWRTPEPIDRDTAKRIARFFRTLSFANLSIGGLWSLVGVMIILADFTPETIGPGLAVALQTLFYSIILSLTVFFPISLFYAGKHDAS